MKIVNQPKIILTTEEADTFNKVVKLLDNIYRNITLESDLTTMVNDAYILLNDIWDNDSIQVE